MVVVGPEDPLVNIYFFLNDDKLSDIPVIGPQK
jgi:hypothetical protein